MRRGLAALAVLFLLAHLFHLPPTLEDIDSINFALGVRDFDVARHRPHPPGYPVFIGLAKAATALVDRLPVANPAPAALGLLSAIAGAASIPLLFRLFRRLAGDDHVAWWAMAVAVSSPLFWFTALRPLSDMTGLAFATASQGLVLTALLEDSPRARPALIAGALLSGLAAGVRVQTVMLTAPLLLTALLWPRSRLSLTDRAVAVGAVAVGVAAWGAPLLAASGGLGGYLAALGTQAGEDFSGVVMLWTTRQARVAVDAVLNTFIWPWTALPIGCALVAGAAIGAVRLAWRLPARFALLSIAFAPYAVFHLLFHETVTMRYALPIVPPVAFLAIYAAAGTGRRAASVAGVAIAAISLVQTVPAARAYAADGSPAFRVFEGLTAAAPAGLNRVAGQRDGTGSGSVLGMHAGMRRVEEWEQSGHNWRVLAAPHGYEWLSLVEHWRAEATPVTFAADPRRTDLAMFDPQSRTLQLSRRWTLPEVPFLAGIRPGNADAFAMRPPGWMLDRGWALTAEIGGITGKDGVGPHVQPSIAWVRGRPEGTELIIGGRHLGAPTDPPARLTLASERAFIDSWEVAPGFFFRRVPLPAGTLDGAGYLPLRVSSLAADGSGRMIRVALEQFDLQPEGTVMFGYFDGWQEPEYNPATGQAWRWTTEQARLWIRPVGRDVVLTLTGESPLRYFDEAPTVRVTAGATLAGQFSPITDFTERITIPAAALAASGGRVTVESDKWFSPAQRTGSPDQRRLALRVYAVSVQ